MTVSRHSSVRFEGDENRHRQDRAFGKPCLCPLPKRVGFQVRRQEKGHFSKGGFCRIQCHSQSKQKIPKGIGPSSTFGTQSATVERGGHVCNNRLSKNPLFLAPAFDENVDNDKIALYPALLLRSCDLRGPNWGLVFVLEFVRSRGFGAKFLQPFPKFLSDHKVRFKHKNGP